MKTNRLVVALLFHLLLGVPTVKLAAQQNVEDRKQFEEFKFEAGKGDSKAQRILGIMYAIGRGVPTNAIEAVKWFHKAAEQGDAAAQCNLGICYANGDGVIKNTVEAAKWFRKASDQGNALAQGKLGVCYFEGEGVPKDAIEAAKWMRKAADQGDALAQTILGGFYDDGDGVAKDAIEAAKWVRKAAEQGDAAGQSSLGFRYYNGNGVTKDFVEAVKWYRKAAEQGDVIGQCNLGNCYAKGEGAIQDFVEAHKWLNLASAHGGELPKRNLAHVEQIMTREQISEAQRLAREFKPRKELASDGSSSPEGFAGSVASGTGFFITEDGLLITNEHVVRDAAQVRLVTSAGLISAKVAKVDAANDLALLKAEGKFSPLPVAASRGVKMGGTVATVGFPNIGLQGFAPKLAKGEIASLSGAGDDARYFQISVPVQPGNSGGALVDERGNVVGVVSAKLSARAALAASGALPENVNYAVKSSYLLSFLESVPVVAAKLKEPETKERKFEDVVKSAEQATVLVLVY